MKKKLHFILIVAFLLLISAPFWGMLFYKNEESHEKRVLASFKDIKGIAELNQYVVDNHAFRDKLSGSCLSFYTKVLKESPLPSRTVFGKDGWMFLGNDYVNVYDASLGIMPIWESDVYNVTHNIVDIKSFCDSLGIEFYFVLAPNKASVYTEYLALQPNNLPRFKTYVMDSLEANFGVHILDLADIILEHKNKDQVPLYYQFDSHWNDYGGLLAAQKITQLVAEDVDIDTISLDDFDLKREIRTAEKDREYDLSNTLNMKVSDTFFDVQAKKQINLEDSIILKWGNTPVVTYTSNTLGDSNVKGFFIRDSFFGALKPYMMSVVDEASFFVFFDKWLILDEIKRNGKPDFLMYVIVERNLLRVRYDGEFK